MLPGHLERPGLPAARSSSTSRAANTDMMHIIRRNFVLEATHWSEFFKASMKGLEFDLQCESMLADIADQLKERDQLAIDDEAQQRER